MIAPERGVPIKAWIRGVSVEDQARNQLLAVAQMPFVYKWVAAMPDVHYGIGATVGSVIPTKGAIIPAAVGVDIGCGMMAVQTSLNARDLPDNLKSIREAIEKAVPHGRTNNGLAGDRGAWHDLPARSQEVWGAMKATYDGILAKHPKLNKGNHSNHLGTLGTGNHFIEVCLDETEAVWFMLHSGSRGVGNRMGSYFIELAKRGHAEVLHQSAGSGSGVFPGPHRALRRLRRSCGVGSGLCAAEPAVDDGADRVGGTEFRRSAGLSAPKLKAINCHHNYVARESHYGENVLVTRKGAVRAREGDLGIIPGSMGARSFIVRGKGNPESFHSCSHGAGRAMSRKEAKRRFTLEDHVRMTEGVECRKDPEVIDETPAAYKPIDAVMAAQSDLVEIVHTLRQVVCVKG